MSAPTRVLKIGDLQFDPVTGLVHRQGERLHLSPMGLKLLRLLMEAAPRLVCRTELEARLWGQNSALMSDANVRQLIHALRAVVDKPFDTPLIRTYHGVGYRLAVPRQPESVVEDRASATAIFAGWGAVLLWVASPGRALNLAAGGPAKPRGSSGIGECRAAETL